MNKNTVKAIISDILNINVLEPDEQMICIETEKKTVIVPYVNIVCKDAYLRAITEQSEVYYIPYDKIIYIGI